MEKGDSYNAIADSYVDSVKGITDKRQWGSMSTKTVIITKSKRTGNVNHIVSFSKETECSCKKGRLLSHDRDKAGMIALISTTLTKMGCYVVLSSGNADVQIVKYSITIPS
ncbi:hypothetical protein DPMN_097094 [Dreissena polymorpha]|uniref:Uncharacterized protein n=1 Tax=Dreissena polymorpha TaxID=45954 RepID=A0A9D4R496_DREPO|nr:hypothetical protein DPMN_097094 [Dreissena polymorpha]